MKDCEIIDKCLLCNGKTKNILSLGSTPLANEFVKEPTKQDLFPLNLIQCLNCNHVQLDCLVDEERMYKNYFYVSSTSKVNQEHFKNYSLQIIEKYSPQKDDLCVEIGSNDGLLLSYLKETCKILGVDPATNLAKIANENGIPTIADFFNEKTAFQIKEKYGQASILVANNCLAHNKDLHTIFKGITNLLKEDGVLIFEFSYFGAVLENKILDVIYAEHIHQWHLKPLIKFLKVYNMQIIDIDIIPNHGGSLRVHAQKINKSLKINYKVINELLEKENNIDNHIVTFKQSIENIKSELLKILMDYKSCGKKIIAFGSPAKWTTLSYYFNIDGSIIDYIVEENPLKIGNFSPGFNIPIYGPEQLLKDKPDIILVAAWNFFEDIYYRYSNQEITWIKPLPTIRIK